jgi:PD-(D/E)XK nuclease superfamily protein
LKVEGDNMPLTLDDYIRLKLTHSIHTSERLSFRGCRRRWNWIFRDGWYPTTTAKPLEFGSAFHTAMESWYDPIMWGKDPEARMALAILAFNRVCEEQKAEYLKTLAANSEGDGELSPEVEEDYRERKELGEGMIRYHCTRISPKLDVGFKPFQVEIEFEVPIEDLRCTCARCWNLWSQSETGDKHYYVWRRLLPEGLGDENFYVRSYQKEWEGLPVTYGGRIDMLALDDLGRPWVFDWKTTARLSGQEDQDAPDEFIQLDDQITSYCWALWTMGIPVAGFVHHEMKKAFPIEPEPLKNQREGRWFSVNKSAPFEHDLYLETITENDPAGLARGVYDDFLDYLKHEGSRFHSRKQVVRSETELRNAGRNIYLEALDMTDPGLRLYPSPGRFACSFCAYRQPCIGTNRDEDVEYMLMSNFVKRDPRYWEHNKPSTESRGGR